MICLDFTRLLMNLTENRRMLCLFVDFSSFPLFYRDLSKFYFLVNMNCVLGLPRGAPLRPWALLVYNTYFLLINY